MLLLVVFVSMLAIVGCGENKDTGVFESTGKTLDNAVHKTGETAGTAVDATGKTAKGVLDKTGTFLKNTTEKTTSVLKSEKKTDTVKDPNAAK